MRAALCKAVPFAAVMVLSAAAAASEELARRYIELRPGVLSATPSTGAMDAEKLRAALKAASQQILSDLKRGPEWNAGHPEWRRLGAIIEADVERALREFAEDPLVAELPRKSEEVLRAGLAQRLSAAELEALIRYYSQNEGARLAELQRKMFDEIAPAIATAQLDMMAGRRSGQPVPDTPEVKEILGLFDEWVRIQFAVSDPGRGGDRAGLQIIPVMVGMAFEINYERYTSLWRALPEADRRAIVMQRESAGAMREREAIYESAKGLRAVMRPEEQMRRLLAILSAYEGKWRSLVPAQ